MNFLLRARKTKVQKRKNTGFLSNYREKPQKKKKFLSKIKNIEKQLERKHIFTHIQWNMRGFYVEVCEKGGKFTWLSSRQIEEESALPTAFRQFWVEAEHP